jgi:hypothetical protein
MNELQSSLQGWPSAVWALAAIVIAVLIYRYAISTAAQRFQAREANAVREQARAALCREDRLKQEERNAATVAANKLQKREDEAREREARTLRLAALREEEEADAGNANCADEAKRILAEADAHLVKICRYYVACDESIDPDEEDPEDPFINLGVMKGKIQKSYDNALDYFDEAQKMMTEGLYIVAKRQAEVCLLEAKYAADRIANLDTTDWNKIQAAVR